MFKLNEIWRWSGEPHALWKVVQVYGDGFVDLLLMQNPTEYHNVAVGYISHRYKTRKPDMWTCIKRAEVEEEYI